MKNLIFCSCIKSFSNQLFKLFTIKLFESKFGSLGVMKKKSKKNQLGIFIYFLNPWSHLQELSLVHYTIVAVFNTLIGLGQLGID